MSTWTYSLKCSLRSLRSLVRAGVRNAWGRAFVDPGLAAHERWIGWRFGQRRAWIRGDIVCPTTRAMAATGAATGSATCS